MILSAMMVKGLRALTSQRRSHLTRPCCAGLAVEMPVGHSCCSCWNVGSVRNCGTEQCLPHLHLHQAAADWLLPLSALCAPRLSHHSQLLSLPQNNTVRILQEFLPLRNVVLPMQPLVQAPTLETQGQATGIQTIPHTPAHQTKTTV
jgi:hypothetical protein